MTRNQHLPALSVFGTPPPRTERPCSSCITPPHSDLWPQDPTVAGAMTATGNLPSPVDSSGGGGRGGGGGGGNGNNGNKRGPLDVVHDAHAELPVPGPAAAAGVRGRDQQESANQPGDGDPQLGNADALGGTVTPGYPGHQGDTGLQLLSDAGAPDWNPQPLRPLPAQQSTEKRCPPKASLRRLALHGLGPGWLGLGPGWAGLDPGWASRSLSCRLPQ